MNVQILVSTMHQKDRSLITKMKLFSNAIVINQCDETGYEQINYKGYKIDWYNTQTRGVGVSRNLAILYSSADVCLFADDDMIYNDQTLDTITSAFQKNKKADMIVFGVNDDKGKKYRDKRLTVLNSLGFATYRLAVRRDSLIKKRIMFSLLFGGGAIYSCGEDTIFINDFLKNKLKCYFSSNVIGTNTKGPSTWFKGYTEKFAHDKGVLMRQIFGLWGIIPLAFLLIKHLEWAENIGKRKMFESALLGWKNFQ